MSVVVHSGGWDQDTQKKMLRFCALLFLALGATAAEEPSLRGSTVRRSLIVYNNPMAGGSPIDFCMAQVNDKYEGCGQPSADAFCKAHGFTKADQFQKAYGLSQSTYFQGSRSYNYGGSADSFVSIDCVGPV